MERYEAVPPAEVRFVSEYLRREGYFASNVGKKDFQFRAPVTAAPEIERESSGTFVLSCATAGASLGFRIWPERQDPPETWQVYTGSVEVSPGHRFEAVAHRIGYRPSTTIWAP